MSTPDRLSPTLRLVDLLTPGMAHQVDPQVLAQVEAALAQTGRTVDRDILLALAGQQQALTQQALVTVPAAPAARVRPSKGWRLGTRWRWWQRSLRRRRAARPVAPRVSSPKAPAATTMGSWQWRMARQARAGCAYERGQLVPALAVAYHRVRRARDGGHPSSAFSKQTRKLLNGTLAPPALAPTIGTNHEQALKAALATAPRGAAWAPLWCYDDPQRAFAYIPLLLDPVAPLLDAFFKSDPIAQRDHQPTDLPLFDTLVRLAVDPDAPFRPGSSTHFPLPRDGRVWAALTPREVLLLACQHQLLQRLIPVVHQPTRGVDSWLWWVIRARQVQPDLAFSQLLQDDAPRVVAAIEATIGWVLAHEDATPLHRKLLAKAIGEEAHPELKGMLEKQLKGLDAGSPPDTSA